MQRGKEEQIQHRGTEITQRFHRGRGESCALCAGRPHPLTPLPSCLPSADAGRGESEWHEWWNSRRGGWWEAGSAAL
ncbi:MAG TPA: hypothetical protein PLQ56_28095, partial [Aggregatilineales bacterium]|nr:hypothetical protein [Aggregatilineales bacterium]